MITEEQKRIIADDMVSLLELPDSAYEKAQQRYEDLGDWLGREESTINNNSPHIFPQGSFRLGTAIRPLDATEEYDLDLACKLREGIKIDTHTQEQLKNLVGIELENYRTSRGIKNELEEKHRCWRLEYQDDLNFHMDIVPCIPADENMQKYAFESMCRSSLETQLSKSASQTTISITDDRHDGYKLICDNWNISNPEGYAEWFEVRMYPSGQLKLAMEQAKVDEVPLFKRKTPLQRAIQILKRHRDIMFKDQDDLKPISIILTTLAARAYSGEQNVATALENILKNMGNFVNSSRPKVPNPVNPEEDFADRWYRSDCVHLRLEENLNNWLLQANADFKHIYSTSDARFITEQVDKKFSLAVNMSNLNEKLRAHGNKADIIHPKKHTIEKETIAKPWRR